MIGDEPKYQIMAAMFQIKVTDNIIPPGSKVLEMPFLGNAIGKIKASLSKKTDVYAHDFFCLLKDGVPIAQLHGLATDKNSKPIPIGYLPEHRLKAWHCVYDQEFAKEYGFDKQSFTTSTFSLDINESYIYEDISSQDAISKWKKAIELCENLNNKDYHYPLFGVTGDQVNSNSFYHTFASCMGIEAHKFEGFKAPGIQNDLYTTQP